MFQYKCQRNLLENIRANLIIQNFPSPIAYWLGLGIFEQNQQKTDNIGMVRQSVFKEELQHLKQEFYGNFCGRILTYSFKGYQIPVFFEKCEFSV